MATEKDELRASARKFLSDADRNNEAHIWQTVVELGWLLIPVPERLGGIDFDVSMDAVVHEEMGRALCSAPLLPAMLAIEALCCSSAADREKWLERAVSGEYFTVPLGTCSISIERRPDNILSLTGTALAVQSADNASHAVIWDSSHETVALVPLQLEGIGIIETTTWDRTRRLFELHLENALVEPNYLLAEGDAAQLLVRRLLIHRDLGLSASSLGAAQSLLETTLDHLQMRKQFGRPLALFQALKHRCADLYTELSAATASLEQALTHLDDACGPSAELEAVIAKHLAATCYARLAEEALQMHGGIGMATEHPCHLYLKRAFLDLQLGREGNRYEYLVADHLISHGQLFPDTEDKPSSLPPSSMAALQTE